MASLDTVISNIKKEGFRLTRARKAIINIFYSSNIPQTAEEINVFLKRKGIMVDKVTIYRELDFLKDRKIIREVNFREGAKRFEILPKQHHHHLVCLNCNRIEEFEMKNDLSQTEKRIAATKNFKVADHMLEFFGYCAKCQSA